MFSIDRPIMTTLTPFQKKIYDIRRKMGCFAPSSSPENDQFTIWCCKYFFRQTQEEFEQAIKEKDIQREMIDEAPDKNMLETHDGVIYFPKELMPDDNDHLDSMRVGGGSLMHSLNGSKGNTIHDIVPPYILKSK